ncbi:protein IRX15-LIKE-like [Lolium rigidum]|uniref:protein IRX15-LIKE-like n=1 Tax=Lolium rigidum TaxID=89674 RepID=UPI001F5C4B11|nr:protein IRX15-LIKE-like [Lolium rigidum]
MMKAMSGPKILIVHPSSNKFGKGAASMSGRSFWLVVLLAVFGSVSLLTVFSTARAASGAAPPRVTFAVGADAASAGASGGALPAHVFDALVRYAAAAGANSTASMPEEDVRAIAAVLRRRAPCNLLVFGLGAETPLWRALNHGGRTVFLDENPFYVAHMEGAHGPGLEAYDVAYATAVRELPDLLHAARASRRAECRPVQNLLYSECRLAITDLPNALYDVAWDVVLVDGPHGYAEGSPGRMAAIYSAAVMARTRGTETDVLVHDFQREVESVCAKEFLCEENRVEGTSTPSLGHYVVRGGGAASREDFCSAPASKKTN